MPVHLIKGRETGLEEKRENEREGEKAREKEWKMIANPLSQEHSQCHRDLTADYNWVPACSASLHISNSDSLSQMKMDGFI